MKIMIALTTINLIVSGTTLTVILVGARDAQKQLQDVKTKTNRTIANIKAAANSIEEM